MEDNSARFLLQYISEECVKKGQEFKNKDGAENVAVIVESRKAFFLPLVIRSVIENIDNNWNIHVFGTRDLISWLHPVFPHILYTELQIEKNTLTIPEYSRLLVSEEFWDCIPEPMVLIFQLDTIMLRPIEDRFMKYPMIGAPSGTNDENFTINGGFSLRKKDAMIDIIQKYSSEYELEEPSDVFFTRMLRRDYITPDMRECAAFCCETLPVLTCAGIHGTDKYYTPCNTLKELYLYRMGETETLRKMKL